MCREVWPNDVFGSDGVSVDEEMELIRNILLDPSAGGYIVIHDYYVFTLLLCAVMPAGRFLGNDEGDDSEGAEEEGGGAAEVSNVEMEFSVRNYIERFVQ